MAGFFGKIGEAFLGLIGDDEETVEENITVIQSEVRTEQPIELASVIDFVRELEAYYTNDIFKEKSSYINQELTEDQVSFLKKKIKSYEDAVQLITSIKDNLLEKERSCRELWGKTSYSFYDELEKTKMKNLLVESFETVKQLSAVNAIPELDEIIAKRLMKYKESWGIEGDIIPMNTSLRIVEKRGNIETYQFGKFQKEIIEDNSGVVLLPEQLRAIKRMTVQFSFKNPIINNVWVRCATISRNQLESLKKSTFFENDWENSAKDEIVYDIVEHNELEYYLRAVMELLLPRKDYVVISIINPNVVFSHAAQNSVYVDLQNKKVKITDRMAFLLPERTGAYGDNLQFEYISRKQNLSQITFQSYNDWIRNFL